MMNTPKFASQQPVTEYTTSEVRYFQAKGPWKTKSDANLQVLFKLPRQELSTRFFHYDPSELRHMPKGFDIRGLRAYTVRGIKKGKVGGTEFHRIRHEILLGLEGRVRVECEDVFKRKREFEVNERSGLYIPPFILHTYEAMDDSGLFVLANTLFNPEDSRTHDTYSNETFHELQARYAR